jgi:HSP20 family protein
MSAVQPFSRSTAPHVEDLAMITNRSRTSTLDRMVTLNRALDQALTSAWTGDNRLWVPAVDVVEKKDAYLLYAELPGVDASQVDMSFEQSVLTIRGTKRTNLEAASEGEMRVYAAERANGNFERSIRLPEFVDGDRITADLSNGVLTVTVPKAPMAQPRRIEINTGNTGNASNTGTRVSDNGQLTADN